jgi:RNA polymerase sigma-70 factor (ECF subfamily)
MPPERSAFSIYTDEELMLCIVQGEEKAFDEIYLRYGKRLFVYFYRMMNYNKDIADDMLQDIFMKIAENPEKFDRTRSFKTWIFSVASNACKNHYRHKQLVREKEDQIIQEHILRSAASNQAAMSLDRSAFRHMLDRTLDQLPVEKKEAFILRYQEEKSIAEIALIQNCPEGSVKSRIHYTLKILEEKMKMFNPAN